MSENDNVITLYPSNWLYNAGVLGFINSINEIEKISVDSIFVNNSIELPRKIFSDLKIEQRYFTEKLCNCLIIGNVPKTKMTKYANYINPSRSQDKIGYKLFVENLEFLEHNSDIVCFLCSENHKLPQKSIEKLNIEWEKNGENSERGFEKFLSTISKYTNAHYASLGAAITEFPNAFWNLNYSNDICPLCSYLVIHQHISMTRINFYSQIFINAPSFKLMYELNSLLNKLYGNSNKEETRKLRDILATTVIEYSRKIQSILGIWTSMNIEIVHKYKIKNDKGKFEDRIEFFSLPSDVIEIITDRNVANILSDLNEFKILNLLLDRKYSLLIEFGYQLLKESSKDFGKRNEKLINSILYQWKNQNNLVPTVNKLLKLYSLIENKLKGN